LFRETRNNAKQTNFAKQKKLRNFVSFRQRYNFVSFCKLFLISFCESHLALFSFIYLVVSHFWVSETFHYSYWNKKNKSVLEIQLKPYAKEKNSIVHDLKGYSHEKVFEIIPLKR
jgi:hypothetical protein